MIRTAILAGLLVVMLAIAYDKSVLSHLSAQPVAVLPSARKPAEQAPVANVARAAPAEKPMSPPQDRAPTVREKLLPDAEEKAVRPTQREEEPRREPVVVETPAAILPPAVAAAPVIAAPPTPVEEPRSAAPAPESKPLQLVPIDDLPLREVATPRVMIPKDLPLRSDVGIVQAQPLSEPPEMEAKSAPPRAPMPPVQLMSRTERTQELYRLAREMEDTFISKLAR